MLGSTEGFGNFIPSWAGRHDKFLDESQELVEFYLKMFFGFSLIISSVIFIYFIKKKILLANRSYSGCE